MKACYHLNMSKPVKQKTLSCVGHGNYPSPEERTQPAHLWGCAHKSVLPHKEARCSSILRDGEAQISPSIVSVIFGNYLTDFSPFLYL